MLDIASFSCCLRCFTVFTANSITNIGDSSSIIGTGRLIVSTRRASMRDCSVEEASEKNEWQ